MKVTGSEGKIGQTVAGRIYVRDEICTQNISPKILSEARIHSWNPDVDEEWCLLGCYAVWLL
jgi:hypothetical protein